MRVLVVEDAADVAEAVAAALGRAGYACDIAGDLAAARDHVGVQGYDVVVLDINLPDGDGRDFLRSLRRGGNRVPVLMLTARIEVSARVDALDDGADDYLVKPFDLRELEARVRALTRREAGRVEARLRLGAIDYDPSAQVVRVGGKPLPLTRREMALLSLLMGHPGHILSKERLFDGLFSFADSEVGVNAVELYIARLRKKLAGSGAVIETHRGLGYRIAEGG
ncbi:response regulator [Oceaniglobus roseus]|uniref:response regulator n=1 Tax=Oceaniglobus roseus TaxID=1737570 RepID=UPI000C7F0207|nr:response regulator transcription factor [Kandeliimicrobium roseum]